MFAVTLSMSMNCAGTAQTTASHAAALLMLRVKAGERETFDALVTQYRTGLVQYLARLVRNIDSAEDLAQETFLRVYRSRAAYEPTAGFQTWLYRIATNVALNHIRDHKHYDAAATSEHDEERID